MIIYLVIGINDILLLGITQYESNPVSRGIFPYLTLYIKIIPALHF